MVKSGAEQSRVELGSAVVGTAWGQVGLVEWRGAVVFLALADDRVAVGEEIALEHPGAIPSERASQLGRQVARAVASGRELGGIPVELSGTEFQEAVWRELARIPRGEVVTYGELAHRIGRPGASRAVGAACGANPVALIVPCHRVVGSGDGLGGYRWGVARKARILRDEGVVPAVGARAAAAG